jgi:hypothetical protein
MGRMQMSAPSSSATPSDRILSPSEVTTADVELVQVAESKLLNIHLRHTPQPAGAILSCLAYTTSVLPHIAAGCSCMPQP